MPRSSTARFSERWQKSVGDEGFIEGVVERWRASSSGAADLSANLGMFAEAMGIAGDGDPAAQTGVAANRQPAVPPNAYQSPTAPRALPAGTQVAPQMRRDLPSSAPRGGVSTAPPSSPEVAAKPGQSLRDKLLARLGQSALKARGDVSWRIPMF